MSFSTIIGKLLSKDSQARAAADSDYRELVHDCASDRSVTEAKITATITAAGKSLADLQAAVDAERRRIADLTVVERRDEIMQALHENNLARIAEDQRYDTEIKSLFESHGAAVSAIVARGKRLDEELGRCDAAERRLVADGPDRLAEIDQELRALSSRDFRLASIGRPQHRHVMRESRVVERQREEVVSKRAALMEERDRIRGEILASN